MNVFLYLARRCSCVKCGTIEFSHLSYLDSCCGCYWLLFDCCHGLMADLQMISFDESLVRMQHNPKLRSKNTASNRPVPKRLFFDGIITVNLSVQGKEREYSAPKHI